MKSRILFFLILILFACQKNNTITLDEIKILLDERDYEIAIKKLNSFIKINKNESDAYNLLGICFLEINEFDKAEINFSNALRLEKNYKFFYNRGNVRREMNKLTLALEDFNEAISIEEKEGDLYNNRGNLYYRMKNYTLAINDFKKFSELQPENEKAYLNIAKSQFLVDDFQSAINNLKIAVKINSEFSEGFFWLGLAHFQINLRKEGCLILKKANELGHPHAKDAININC
tara:strand:- start:1049 stop:1744 length:696 start_codon:yes stop_codon:yes gene_type:complete